MRLFEPIPLRLLAPNAVTAAGMTLGFASLIHAARGDFSTAAWFIALAALADKLDGTVARLLDASSAFGVQFDSFSDFCTFGLSPAALVYFAAQREGGGAWVGGAGGVALTAICALYAVAASVRLARFNVTTEAHPKVFQGLPTTVSGSVLGLFYLACHELGASSPAVVDALPYGLVGLGALMVSNLPLPKLAMPTAPAARVFFVGQVVGVYLLVPLRAPFSATYGLALSLGYVLVGFARGLAEERAAAAPAADGQASEASR